MIRDIPYGPRCHRHAASAGPNQPTLVRCYIFRYSDTEHSGASAYNGKAIDIGLHRSIESVSSRRHFILAQQRQRFQDLVELPKLKQHRIMLVFGFPSGPVSIDNGV